MNFGKGLAARLAMAAAAVAAAIVVGKASLALAWAERRTVEALRLDSRQPDALARAAYTVLSNGALRPDAASAPEMRRAEQNALKALAIDPTNVRAVSDIALLRDLQGRREAATGLMRYAERLSRRDLITQLWWIEYMSAQGDVAETLRHFDVALRTSSSAPSILFPILVTASIDPEIAAPLSRLVARRPAWADQFVQQLAQSSPDPAAAASFLGRMASLDAPASGRALATVVDRLIEGGRPDVAFALFSRYRPEAARQPIRNGDFSDTPAEPTAFDWGFPQEGVSASIDRDGLHVDAAAGGGVAARQLVRLQPGRRLLRLSYQASEDVGAGGAEPVLSMRCAGSGLAIAAQPATNAGSRTLAFDIPSSCPLQILEIAVRGGDGLGSAGATIRELQLVQ